MTQNEKGSIHNKIWLKYSDNTHYTVCVHEPADLSGYEEYNRLEKEKCDCNSWGCMYCCSSDAEMRAAQGVFG